MTTNEKIVYDTAIAEGMLKINAQLPGLIVAQAKHESNDFSSNVFKTCNNAFGYKYVGQKLAVGACSDSPEGNKYAKYRSLEDSTREVCQWIKRRQSQFAAVNTPEDFASALKNNGYFGDSLGNYSAALRRHYNAIKDGITEIINRNPEVSMLTGFTILSMIGYYIYRVAKIKK